MAENKRYIVRITEENPREAIIEAESEKEAIEYAERLWEDSYDNFLDIQDLGHRTEVVGEDDGTDSAYLPCYPQDL